MRGVKKNKDTIGFQWRRLPIITGQTLMGEELKI